MTLELMRPYRLGSGLTSLSENKSRARALVGGGVLESKSEVLCKRHGHLLVLRLPVVDMGLRRHNTKTSVAEERNRTDNETELFCRDALRDKTCNIDFPRNLRIPQSSPASINNRGGI